MQKKPYQLLSLLKYGIKMRHRGVDCGDIDASVCVLIVSYRSVIINALKALIILIWLTVESGVHCERRRVLSTKKPVWAVSYYAVNCFLQLNLANVLLTCFFSNEKYFEWRKMHNEESKLIDRLQNHFHFGKIRIKCVFFYSSEVQVAQGKVKKD